MSRTTILIMVILLALTPSLGQEYQEPYIETQEQLAVNETEPLVQPAPVPQQPSLWRNFSEFKLDADTLQRFRYEVGAIVAIFAYLLLYRLGKNQNIAIMEGFYAKVRGYVETNFAHVGFTKNSWENPFVSESPSEAMFYASGRENIDYMEIKFNMRKRHDLIYYFIYELIWPEKDLITVDIPLEVAHPIVLCLANQKKFKKITEKNLDIAKLAGSFEAKGLNSMQVLSQAQEIVDSIIDSNIARKLNDLSSLFYSIHYTDQKFFSESGSHLRAIIFASVKNEDKYLPALELLFQLVDKITGLKIPANYKAKALKAREAFNATVEKEKLEKHKQQMRKQKQEKNKKFEAWLRSLPPEKQKKQDEKRKKKEINKILKSKVMKA